MKKTYFFFVAFGLWAIATAVSQPRETPHVSEGTPILTGTSDDRHALEIIERSCQNCHSANTKWPAYSRLFPISMLIQHDVREARAHMNLSEWQHYDKDAQSRYLAEIGSVVRNHIMPPSRYTALHPEAKLSPEEVDSIYQWTRTNRQALRHE